jgi:hypothetical protein
MKFQTEWTQDRFLSSPRIHGWRPLAMPAGQCQRSVVGLGINSSTPREIRAALRFGE